MYMSLSNYLLDSALINP